MKEAITKAIEGGYKLPEFLNSKQSYEHIVQWYDGEKTAIIHLTFQPLFWHCLFGQKYGRIKALEFINHIFDGGTAEQYFEQVAGMGQKQQEETSPKVLDMPEGGKETSQ